MPILNPALSEFVRTENAFIERMVAFRDKVLTSVVHDLNPEDKDMVNDYLHKVNQLETSYKGLNLHKADSDVDLIHALDNKFKTHMKLVTELGLLQQSMDEIAKKTPSINLLAFTAYTIDSVQRCPRYIMLFTEAKKLESKRLTMVSKIDAKLMEHGLLSLDDKTSLFGEKDDSIECLSDLISASSIASSRFNVELARIEGENKALRDYKNKPTQILSDCLASKEALSETEKAEKAGYLSKMLTLAYPVLLKQDEVLNALGGKDNVSVPDPALFDVKALVDLYKKDQNPLWVVLVTMVPTHEVFNALDKFQYYQTIANLIQQNKIPSEHPEQLSLMIAERAFKHVQSQVSELQNQMVGRLNYIMELQPGMLAKESSRLMEKITSFFHKLTSAIFSSFEPAPPTKVGELKEKYHAFLKERDGQSEEMNHSPKK